MADPRRRGSDPARSQIRKIGRYSVASLAGTFTGQGTLVFCVAVLGWSGVVSNLTSVSLGAVPNYLINRYWTWKRAGTERLAREGAVFWLMAMLGLLVSTGFVAYADRRWGTTLAIALAQLSGFGLLWVAKFLFLDRVLYRAVDEILEHEPAGTQAS